MALNDLYGVRFQFRTHGVIWTVGLGYRDTNGVDELFACNDLAVAANTTLGPLFDACRGNDSTREGTYCWKVIKGTGMPDQIPDASVIGNQPEVSTSPNNCMVISLRTDDPLAKRHGRIYITSQRRDGISNGRWSTGQVDMGQQLADGIKTPLIGSLGTWQPCIIRRWSDGLKLDPPQYSDISNATVTDIVYTQRRRNSRQIGTIV